MSPKMEEFARLFVATGNASAAYRQAYGSRGNARTCACQANKLLKRADVRTKVAELRAAVDDKATDAVAHAVVEAAITKSDVLRELWDNAMKSKQALPVLDKEGRPVGKFTLDIAASNGALIAIGKMLGMFRDAPPTPYDPLDGFSHEDLKAYKALLEESLKADDEASVAGAPAARRKMRH